MTGQDVVKLLQTMIDTLAIIFFTLGIAKKMYPSMAKEFLTETTLSYAFWYSMIIITHKIFMYILYL